MTKVILIAVIGASLGSGLGSRLAQSLDAKNFKILDSQDFDSYYRMLQKTRKIDKFGIYFQKQKYIPPKNMGRKYLSNNKKRRY